jgi:hypothetical protein
MHSSSHSSSVPADLTVPMDDLVHSVQSTDFEVLGDEPRAFGEYDLLEEIGAGEWAGCTKRDIAPRVESWL